MNKDGFFLATFVLGMENYEGDEWVYPGCVYFKHNHILKMVRAQGLDAIQTKWMHPNNQTWYVIFHPENRSNARKNVRKMFSYNKRKFIFKKYAERKKFLNNPLTRKIYNMFKSKNK